MNSVRTQIRPSGHIWMSAEQFFNAGETLYKSDQISKLVAPIVMNFAFSAELSIKSIEAYSLYGERPMGNLVSAAKIQTDIRARNHQLNELFYKLKADNQTKVIEWFLSLTGEPLIPLIDKCTGYFVNVRYIYEANQMSYDISAIRTLASGLLRATRSVALGLDVHRADGC